MRQFDPGPVPFAVITDQNGLDDVAATYLAYDSLLVPYCVARRADQEVGCRGVVYVENDTLGVTNLIPGVLPGRPLIPMEMKGNGLFVGSEFCSPTLNPFTETVVCEYFPNLRSLRDEFGFTPCVSSTEWLATFVVFPPLVLEPTTVFITEIDLTYVGLKVIAVDAGGLSDTLILGDLKIKHLTEQEGRIAP